MQKEIAVGEYGDELLAVGDRRDELLYDMQFRLNLEILTTS